MEFGLEEFKQMASGLGHRVRKFDYQNVILLCTKQDLIFYKIILELKHNQILYNSGEPWQFTDWGPGKPENDGTALNILWDFYAGCLWKWNDDHTEKSTPYICETKMSNNRTSL